ncbi:MAG: tetratricopeptide repeat protein [Candidatus Omnitrophica bacterium]|nr:tetratricopeptide repeat protein [Candidatus Omnitrophota bacterium]
MTPNPYDGKVFYRLGLECQNKCSLNKQLAYFRKAVFYDPNLSDAYDQLGAIYNKEGQYKQKIKSYQRVVQLDHTNAEAFFNVGLYYLQKGELDYALRYLLQSNRYRPGSDDTFYYIANAYDQKGMYEKAAFYYITLIIWRSPRSQEVCERIWTISKISGQQQMVLDRLWIAMRDAGMYPVWEQIDQYIKTDRYPNLWDKSIAPAMIKLTK